MTDEDFYEVQVLDGNHGPWLFIRLNGQVCFEQAGMESEQQARSLGHDFVAALRPIRAAQRACEHTWKETKFIRSCVACGALLSFDGETVILATSPRYAGPLAR